MKYERAVKKLTKDRDVLLTFYNLPAEHWQHIRTTNPIESVFATVRNRTRKTKGCLSRKTALSLVFKLMLSAKKKWRKLSGTNRLPEVIQGGVSSRTGSSNFRKPPNQTVTNFWGITPKNLLYKYGKMIPRFQCCENLQPANDGSD